MEQAPGLKVSAKWLRLMRCGRKTTEVRGYPPSWFRTLSLLPGERFCLLCDGEVWGSARYEGLRVYGTPEALAADEHRHALLEGGGSIAQGLRQQLLEGKLLYGWRLAAFAWCALPRPRSGEAAIPAFKGQALGWVWSPPLPASLRELPAVRGHARRSRTPHRIEAEPARRSRSPLRSC